jgi:hypothetical protein
MIQTPKLGWKPHQRHQPHRAPLTMGRPLGVADQLQLAMLDLWEPHGRDPEPSIGWPPRR